jgi:hypothetical protein
MRIRTKRKLGILLFGLLGVIPTVVIDAHAIIGMPVTPMSYAGVARRTVRRSVYY